MSYEQNTDVMKTRRFLLFQNDCMMKNRFLAIKNGFPDLDGASPTPKNLENLPKTSKIPKIRNFIFLGAGWTSHENEPNFCNSK